MKIVQIDGFRGIITALFVATCLFAGFVMFPGVISEHLWNTYLVNLCQFPVINLFQGTLLWGIVAVSYAIIFKNDFALSFRNSSHLTERELSNLISKSAIHSTMEFPKDKTIIKNNTTLNNKEFNKDLSNHNMTSPFDVKKEKISKEEEKTTTSDKQ